MPRFRKRQFALRHMGTTRDGVPAWMESIYREKAVPLARTAARVTRDESDAWDATHKVFEKLHQSPPEHTPSDAYLFAAVKREAIRIAAGRRRFSTIDAPADVPRVAATGCHQLLVVRGPDGDLVRRETLNHYIRILAPKSRTVVRLWLEGFKYAEIAIRCHICQHRLKTEHFHRLKTEHGEGC
jgi:DNA-directed RNA polymerase specialized sigma24 family protein